MLHKQSKQKLTKGVAKHTPVADQVLQARFDLQGTLWFELPDGWQTAEEWWALQAVPNDKADKADKATLRSRLAMLTTVWVPSEQVSLLAEVVPGKRRADWLTALPFAFEEKLAEPLESLHLVVLNRQANAKVSIAAVAHVRMRQWVEALQRNGLEKAALVADCFQVPVAASLTEIASDEAVDSTYGAHWAVFEQSAQPWSESARVLVRCAEFGGFACQPAWWKHLQSLQPEIQFENTPVDALQITLPVAVAKTINLRSGHYAPQSTARIGRFWYWPAVAAAALVVSYLATLHIQTRFAQQEAALYEAQSVALFKARFPEVKRIVNLRAQAKSAFMQTAEPNSQQGPMQIVKLIEAPFQTANQVQLQRLEWKSAAGQVSLQVSATQVQHLQALQQALQAVQGLKQVELKVRNVSQTQAEGVLYVAAD
ncbi:MAG: hypothetical protein IE928_08250 [Gammaproteobacteria bacterium]|nr:hypothetical protein [Gammaproteobacteria bacterium]